MSAINARAAAILFSLLFYGPKKNDRLFPNGILAARAQLPRALRSGPDITSGHPPNSNDRQIPPF